MDVSQYLEIFVEETREHLQNLNEHLLVLEKEPENKDTINEIFRAAHSLKGMAGTMGYKRMQNLTHNMENVFSEIRNDKMKVTSELVDTLFQCLDALETYLDNIVNSQDEGTEDNEAIIIGYVNYGYDIILVDEHNYHIEMEELVKSHQRFIMDIIKIGNI
jgi:two-component system chemotaxis sensor kinase CheA